MPPSPTTLQPNATSSSPPSHPPQLQLHPAHLYSSSIEFSNQFFEDQISIIRRRADQFRQICDSVQSLLQTDHINCMTLIQCKEQDVALGIHRSYVVEACADLVEITRLYSESGNSQWLPPALKESFRLHDILIECIRTLDSHHTALNHHIMRQWGRSDDGDLWPERRLRYEMEDGDAHMGAPTGAISVLPPRVAKRKNGKVIQGTSTETSTAL